MMSKIMNACLCAGLFFVAIVTCNAEEKNSDGTAPKIQRGFRLLSDQELQNGELLLFDGKSMFGWEARPLVNKRPIGVPDPKITIAHGEMTITTQIPIEISTQLLFTEGSVAAVHVRREEGTVAGYYGPQSSEQKEILMKSIRRTEETLTFGGQPNHSVLLATVAIVIEKGTLVIESAQFRPGGTVAGDHSSLMVGAPGGVALFNGVDLTGWKVGGESKAEVIDGTIHLTGGSGWLESEEEFGDFYFRTEFKENASPNNSGLFFRTIPESAMDGYECQMNNNPPDADREKFLGNDTGSLFRRAAARRVVTDPSDWTSLTVMASGNFFRTWVNGIPTLLWTDERSANANPRKGCRLTPGTIQFQGHDAGTDVSIRNVFVASAETEQQKRLAEQVEMETYQEAEGDAFEAFRPRMEKLHDAGIELTDFHIHIRGGMTPERALWRQKKTGILSGVLENAGRDWPISDNEKLADFIANAERIAFRDDPNKKALRVGIQVNDRDWFSALDPELIKRLDFVLADTMIMGTDENGKPQRLWLLPADYDANPEEWMDRYLAHNLQILDEPITILANPTYLPEFLADRYDELWTDERMDAIIDKGVEKGIAFEIQAESPFPKDRFIQRAIDKGAKWSFGTNNFDARLKNLDHWNEVLEKFNLGNDQILKK